LQRAYLVCETATTGPQEVTIGTSLTLGRAGDCGFVIDDAAASRRHVMISLRNGQYFWRDLGSTNGTLINGARMLEGLIKKGDKLQIGETVLRFDFEELPDDPIAKDESTIFKKTMMDWRHAEDEGERAVDKSEALLRAVYSVMNEIASNYEPCNLVDRILETTLNAIDAQRGAIFFAVQGKSELLACPVCGKYHMISDGKLRHVQAGEIAISSTVAHHVLSRGESVLFTEGDTDSPMNMAQSIMSLQIRSIICVPLRGKYGNIGILYIDSSRVSQQYTNEDLLLATAVGNSSGLALENANMHREIVEKERIEQDIQYAWTIQEGFLFKDWPPEEGKFQVYGEMRPAKIVGGDFYDFVQPDPDHVGILIGDVSGKGVSAALTMAQILAEFRIRAIQFPSPAVVLQTLNTEFFLRSKRGTFCTMCYISLELSTGKLSCANAGHHPPLRLTKGEVKEIAPASGPPVGVVKGTPWKDVTVKIEPGDLFLLYTDGIAEARAGTRTPGQEDALGEYGIEMLSKLVSRNAERSPRRIIEAINFDVVEHCKPGIPHDDCTMIAMRYTP
jgi:sigma-B regulation protein RsbU (phosphoserine phosphatase)